MNDTPTLKPCKNSPECLHPGCADCRKPMRAHGQKLVDHPGTMSKRADGLCHRCSYHTVTLTEDDLQDSGHVLLSRRDMAALKALHPEMYNWHMARRDRMGMDERKALKIAQRRDETRKLQMKLDLERKNQQRKEQSYGNVSPETSRKSSPVKKPR